jgi:hypothetical protein
MSQQHRPRAPGRQKEQEVVWRDYCLLVDAHKQTGAVSAPARDETRKQGRTSRVDVTVMRTGTKVLVAERESEWQGWVDQLRATARSVCVITQRSAESASAFAARVRSEMQRIEGSLDEAVLVGGLACDPEVLAARALIIRALTSRMPSSGRLRLDGNGRGNLAMEALAQIVSDQLQASGVEVVTERSPAPLPLAA